MSIDRREFLKTGIKAGAIGALTFTVGGLPMLLTPAEAQAKKLPFKILSNSEADTLAAFGEALLPGAAKAGIAHFVDQQLAVAPADCLLMIRYMDVPPPYVGFYKACLNALDLAARQQLKKPLSKFTAAEAEAFVGKIAQQNPEGWQAPPSAFAYFVMRADAVDVVYGTPEGFEKLGVPYMPHIMPPTAW
ncbi:MAG: gluconate 2-dehydrogenase subunit 3 family protein [Gammaproteobacteria bacterium]|nr:gluconate 2-dehydrogenase subunit 3 family protein [Gammaproteobacteria bacterium]